MNNSKKEKFLTRIIIMFFLALLLALGIIGFLIFKNDPEKKEITESNNNNNNNGFNPGRYYNHPDSEKTELFHNLKWMLNSPYYLAIEKIPMAGSSGLPALNVIAREQDRKEEHFLLLNTEEEEFKEISQKFYSSCIGYCDLHPAHWEEIIKLVKEKNSTKAKIYEETLTRFRNKLEQQGVYYYIDKRKNRRFSYDNKKRQYYLETFVSLKNGLPIWLRIAKNHLILTNFSFQTGVYQVDTRVPLTSKTGYYNLYIEPQDQIAIKLLPDFSY